MIPSCQSAGHQSWRRTTLPSRVRRRSASNTRTPASYRSRNPSRQFSGALPSVHISSTAPIPCAMTRVPARMSAAESPSPGTALSGTVFSDSGGSPADGSGSQLRAASSRARPSSIRVSRSVSSSCVMWRFSRKIHADRSRRVPAKRMKMAGRYFERKSVICDISPTENFGRVHAGEHSAGVDRAGTIRPALSTLFFMYEVCARLKLPRGKMDRNVLRIPGRVTVDRCQACAYAFPAQNSTPARFRICRSRLAVAGS